MSKTEPRKSIWQSRVDTNMQRPASQILDFYPEARDHSPVEKAAAIHHHVNTEIEYEKRDFDNNPRDLRLPLECWNTGAGNCQEKSLVTASLLSGVGHYTVHTVALSREGGGKHRILEIEFPYHYNHVSNTLWDFYKRSDTTESFSDMIAFVRGDENTYTSVIADTGSAYLGDLGHLKSMGYVVDPPDDDNAVWDYYQEDSVIQII